MEKGSERVKQGVKQLTFWLKWFEWSRWSKVTYGICLTWKHLQISDPFLSCSWSLFSLNELTYVHNNEWADRILWILTNCASSTPTIRSITEKKSSSRISKTFEGRTGVSTWIERDIEMILSNTILDKVCWTEQMIHTYLISRGRTFFFLYPFMQEVDESSRITCSTQKCIYQRIIFSIIQLLTDVHGCLLSSLNQRISSFWYRSISCCRCSFLSGCLSLT